MEGVRGQLLRKKRHDPCQQWEDLRPELVFPHMTIVETIEKMDSLLTVEMLGKLLSMSEKTLYKAIRSGKLPAYRLGGSIRLEPTEVAKWLRQRSTKQQKGPGIWD